MVAEKLSVRTKDNPAAVAVRCPYCGAQPGEGCRVRQPEAPQYGRNYEPSDKWGWPTVHRTRIKAAAESDA